MERPTAEMWAAMKGLTTAQPKGLAWDSGSAAAWLVQLMGKRWGSTTGLRSARASGWSMAEARAASWGWQMDVLKAARSVPVVVMLCQIKLDSAISRSIRASLTGLGACVGSPEGWDVGLADGASLGFAVGLEDGEADGATVGLAEGDADGSVVGCEDGASVGRPVGLSVVGAADGNAVGVSVGASVSPGCVGAAVCGAGVGSRVGEDDGLDVGAWISARRGASEKETTHLASPIEPMLLAYLARATRGPRCGAGRWL